MGTAVLVYHLASRLAYVLYIGLTLRRQDTERHLTSRYGVEEAFKRFRRRAALVMYNDAASFVVLCIVTRSTFHPALPRSVELAAGVVLVLLGLSVKLWAAATLRNGAYYWRNFFTPTAPTPPIAAGPYRIFKDPMYTLGYLQTYGFALVCDSWPGLVVSLPDHLAILIFYYLVERPHHRKLYGAAG